MKPWNKALVFAYTKGYRVDSEGLLYNPKGEKLSPTKDTCGYLKFNLVIEKKSNTIYLHRLQAYQKFKNLVFNEGIQVRHLNDIKVDNSYGNIEIGTQVDNRQDIPPELRKEYSKAGLQKAVKAAALKCRRFTDEEVKSIRQDYKACKSYKKVMLKYKINSKGTLHYILNNALY